MELAINLILGVILIYLGKENMKGNIGSLHFYHRKRVSEENRLPFGRLVGVGTIIVGVGIMCGGLCTYFGNVSGRDMLAGAGGIIVMAGIVVGLGISIYAMIKYNKGIF